jgi:hypothetical protein
VASVLAYRKYAPRDSPPASLDFGRNTPTFFNLALASGLAFARPRGTAIPVASVLAYRK